MLSFGFETCIMAHSLLINRSINSTLKQQLAASSNLISWFSVFRFAQTIEQARDGYSCVHLSAKNYHNVAEFGKVIVPIRRVQFFMPHSVGLFHAETCLLRTSIQPHAMNSAGHPPPINGGGQGSFSGSVLLRDFQDNICDSCHIV